MAKKFKLMRFLQEAHGSTEVTNRRPSPLPPAIFLMQLRQQQTPTPFSTRAQSLVITPAWPSSPEVALPIRINHSHLDPWYCDSSLPPGSADLNE